MKRICPTNPVKLGVRGRVFAGLQMGVEDPTEVVIIAIGGSAGPSCLPGRSKVVSGTAHLWSPA